MDVLLIPGLWLTGSVWDGVVAELADLGHRGVALTLPGQGDGVAGATFADQADAVAAAVDDATRPNATRPNAQGANGEGATGERVLVVGHSAASTLAWVAADARVDRVAGVVLVGGVPASDGATYADFFEPQGSQVPFPGWQPFEGPDTADLDEAARADLERTMVPVPAAVTRGTVRLHDPRRHDVPVVLLCPEFSPEQAREWIASDVPELQQARRLRLVDLDSGHWPMVSRPRLLARAIADVCAEVGADAGPTSGR